MYLNGIPYDHILNPQPHPHPPSSLCSRQAEVFVGKPPLGVLVFLPEDPSRNPSQPAKSTFSPAPDLDMFLSLGRSQGIAINF